MIDNRTHSYTITDKSLILATQPFMNIFPGSLTIALTQCDKSVVTGVLSRPPLRIDGDYENSEQIPEGMEYTMMYATQLDINSIEMLNGFDDCALCHNDNSFTPMAIETAMFFANMFPGIELGDGVREAFTQLAIGKLIPPPPSEFTVYTPLDVDPETITPIGPHLSEHDPGVIGKPIAFYMDLKGQGMDDKQIASQAYQHEVELYMIDYLGWSDAQISVWLGTPFDMGYDPEFLQADREALEALL